MDADRSWRIIEQQRLAIADLVDGLSAEQWEALRCVQAGGSGTSPPMCR
jgi:hypothetical protein